MKEGTGVKTTLYTCLYCGKLFDRQDHMVRHVRIHTGEKPWSCGICGRRFNTKGNVKTHEKTHLDKTLRETNLLE